MVYIERRIGFDWGGATGVLIVDAGEAIDIGDHEPEPEKDMDGTFYHPPDEGGEER